MFVSIGALRTFIWHSSTYATHHPVHGQSYSPAHCLMVRHTRSLLPLSEDLLKPVSADPTTISSEITCHREVSKSWCDKHVQLPLSPLAMGSHVYAKTCPSHQGDPWSMDLQVRLLAIHHLVPMASILAVTSFAETVPSYIHAQHLLRVSFGSNQCHHPHSPLCSKFSEHNKLNQFLPFSEGKICC